MTIAQRGAALLATAALCATPLGIAPAAAQAQPTHVAIAVAGDHSACVAWHSGMTGADVLGAAYAVTWGQQPPYVGFVLQIDRVGTLRPDDNHYWSYWHNTGGGWSYSGRGATSTTVSPGTVEGWSYVNGSTSASPPPTATYASICAGQDPRPTPTRHPSTTAPRPSTSATHSRPSTRAPSRATRTTATAQRTSSGTPARSTTAASTPSRAKPSPARSPSASRDPTPRTSVIPASPTAASVATAASPSASPRAASDDAALPSWTTALALLVVAGIGAAALIRIRGSRR